MGHYIEAAGLFSSGKDVQGRVDPQPLRDNGEQPRLVGGPSQSLAGIWLLVIKDEILVALEIASVLEDAGAAVIGPAATTEQALNFIEEITIGAALLDGNLDGCPVDEIATALTRRIIPFLFISGYGAESLPRAFGKAPMLGKPFTPDALVVAVSQLVTPRDDIVQIRSNSNFPWYPVRIEGSAYQFSHGLAKPANSLRSRSLEFSKCHIIGAGTPFRA